MPGAAVFAGCVAAAVATIVAAVLAIAADGASGSLSFQPAYRSNLLLVILSSHLFSPPDHFNIW